VLSSPKPAVPVPDVLFGCLHGGERIGIVKDPRQVASAFGPGGDIKERLILAGPLLNISLAPPRSPVLSLYHTSAPPASIPRDREPEVIRALIMIEHVFALSLLSWRLIRGVVIAGLGLHTVDYKNSLTR
jgi:hypothetical protein